MWVLSASSSEHSLCDEVMVLQQRRHIESLVPSKLAMCWKVKLFVYRETETVWMATIWPLFMRRNDLERYFESTPDAQAPSGSGRFEVAGPRAGVPMQSPLWRDAEVDLAPIVRDLTSRGSFRYGKGLAVFKGRLVLRSVWSNLISFRRV
jgi:hypothetical protein